MVVVNLYRFEEVAAKAGAPPRGAHREHRHRRTHHDSRRRQELPGRRRRHLARRLRRHPRGAARHGGELSLETTLAARAESVPHHRRLRPRHQRSPASSVDVRPRARLPRRPRPSARRKLLALRYGENPHQSAALYGERARRHRRRPSSCTARNSPTTTWSISTPPGSWSRNSTTPPSAIIKHTNPCGCAEQTTLAEAYRKAFEADPVSAFGSVLAFNRTVDEETAHEITKTFVEAIAAPDYSPDALEILDREEEPPRLDARRARRRSAGRQVHLRWLPRADRRHSQSSTAPQAVVKTKRQPTDDEWSALEFGWKVVKHVKSNAIVYARAGQTVGVGAGQMSRVDSVKVGAMKAVLPLAGTVVASDAFFPFPDGLEEAAKNGVTAVIQPGGSVRDDDVIAAADRLESPWSSPASATSATNLTKNRHYVPSVRILA